MTEKNIKTVFISFRTDSETKARITRLARLQKVTRSDLLRRLVLEEERKVLGTNRPTNR